MAFFDKTVKLTLVCNAWVVWINAEGLLDKLGASTRAMSANRVQKAKDLLADGYDLYEICLLASGVNGFVLCPPFIDTKLNIGCYFSRLQDSGVRPSCKLSKARCRWMRHLFAIYVIRPLCANHHLSSDNEYRPCLHPTFEGTCRMSRVLIQHGDVVERSLRRCIDSQRNRAHEYGKCPR